MSDDECNNDPDHLRYDIINDDWRSVKLIQYLRVLDRLKLDMRYNEFGRYTSPGSHFRNRCPSDIKGNRAAVINLPRNFLREEFLDKLDQDQLEALRLKPEVNLTIPDHLKL